MTALQRPARAACGFFSWTIQVDLRNGQQFSPAFRAINPEYTAPVLELDNGTRIADIVAICRYFEELHPDPPFEPTRLDNGKDQHESRQPSGSR